MIDIVRVGVPVARCDLIDSLAMHAVNEHSGLREPELPTLFLEFHGAPAAVDERGRDGSPASRPSTAAASSRGPRPHRSAPRCGGRATRRTSPAAGCVPGALPYTTDVCVPISALPEMIALAERLTSELPFPGPMVGHVADGNFHTQLLVRDDPGERRLAKGYVDALVARAHELGGTCTGEHGIGIGKREALLAEVGEEGVEVMRAIKRALDPLDLLNPGKVLLDAPAPVPASQR